jgi:hypothetical protein
MSHVIYTTFRRKCAAHTARCQLHNLVGAYISLGMPGVAQKSFNNIFPRSPGIIQEVRLSPT